MGQRGKERQVMIEESGVLRESETPSGDLLGYSLRYGLFRELIGLVGFIVFCYFLLLFLQFY